ncbi:glutamine amidotransferase, partial [bacterium]|nr:glutamine amidotransferase [bacterium]
VDVKSPEETPTSIRELQAYDSVILSNVSAERIPVSQQRMIETAVRDLGIGLIMLGGPESFGAGGWQGSPIEDALPVSMDVKQRKIIPSGALALIMHSCEIPQGNYWSQEISMAALNVLGRNDYMGFLRFSMQAGGPAWLFPLEKVGNKTRMRNYIQNLRFNDIGDMPSFDNTLQLAYDSLVEVQTNVKHIVILSDGDPAQPSQALVDSILADGITISTVCIAPHGQNGIDLMSELADYCNGKFYHVKNNKNLPKIFIKEASTIRRNMLVEETFTPSIQLMSEMILGFESGFPTLDGYVVAGIKDQAETVLMTDKSDPLLAHWRYGLGKTAAFTSDAKARWANSWLSWDQYSKFWGQVVRWTLRSSEDDNFVVQTSVEGERVRIAIDAMTQDGEFLNDLKFKGSVLNPALEPIDVDVRQTQPGRYEAELSAKEAGSYLMNLSYEQKNQELEGRLTAGISVPYSPEHSTTKQNDVILKQLQELSGNPFLEPDQSIFEHNLVATGDIKPLWPLMIALAIIFFFLDIAVRRVFFELTQLELFLARVKAWLLYPFTRKLAPVGPATEQLGNLMQAKQRAGERTQAQAGQKEALLQKLESQQDVDAPDVASAKSDAPWQEVKPGEEAPKFEEEKNEYTSALFRAKQRASSRMKDKK